LIAAKRRVGTGHQDYFVFDKLLEPESGGAWIALH
jgi:hypothetical protein